MLAILILALCLQTGITHGYQCTPPFHPVGRQCLYFGPLILEDHENSRAVCQSLGGHSVRITEPQQLKYIVDYIQENDYVDLNFWLDGTDIKEEGKWEYSNGEAVPMGTPFWGVLHSPSGHWYQQPDNAHGTENCLEIYMAYHHYFNDRPCHVTRSIICEEEVDTDEYKLGVSKKEISCPPLFVPVSGLCLAFLTFAEQTWAEARQTCNALGGQLAKLTQPQHLRDIHLYLHEEGLNEDSFWLGGSDQENEGIWLYTDGSIVPLGTPFWGIYTAYEQEPDNGTMANCLSLTAPGQHYFRDDPCDIIYSPLCLIDPM